MTRYEHRRDVREPQVAQVSPPVEEGGADRPAQLWPGLVNELCERNVAAKDKRPPIGCCFRARGPNSRASRRVLKVRQRVG